MKFIVVFVLLCQLFSFAEARNRRQHWTISAEMADRLTNPRRKDNAPDSIEGEDIRPFFQTHEEYAAFAEMLNSKKFKTSLADIDHPDHISKQVFHSDSFRSEPSTHERVEEVLPHDFWLNKVESSFELDARRNPTRKPTNRPTRRPTRVPTDVPTLSPDATPEPTESPTESPTPFPSEVPSPKPTRIPSAAPSLRPSREPSARPTATPIANPTCRPTRAPTDVPTARPTIPKPTRVPTEEPTARPTILRPTRVPTANPTVRPRPTVAPSSEPVLPPVSSPSTFPTDLPVMPPSQPPLGVPTMSPTTMPIAMPTVPPVSTPTVSPTTMPIAMPTVPPVSTPTMAPTGVSGPVPLYALNENYNFDGTNSVYKGALPKSIFKYYTVVMSVTTTATSGMIMQYGRSPSNFNGELMFELSNGYPLVTEYNNGYGCYGSGSTKINSGSRVHVAFVKNATTIQFYVNGVASGKISSSNIVSFVNNYLTFGMDYRDNNKFFRGTLDNIMIFDYALTADAILMLKQNYMVPPTRQPTSLPTFAPTAPTATPTARPSSVPTVMPPTVAVYQGGINISPTIGFQAVDALGSSNAAPISGSLLRNALRTVITNTYSQRTSMLQAIFTNPGKNDLNNLTWSLTHDSVVFNIGDSATALAMLMSNYDYAGSGGSPQVLATASFVGSGRVAAFGVNPFHVPMSNQVRFMKNVVSWLNKGDPSTIKNFNFTIAHLPGQSSYWFSQDIPTHAWFKSNYPLAKVNAINSCDNTALAGCLARTNVLIIGCQYDRVDDSAVIATTTDAPAIASAVSNFLKQGGSVIYVHYYRDNNKLSNSLLPVFGITSTTLNYWRQSGLRLANPLSSAVSTPVDSYFTLLQTLSGITSFNESDVSSCRVTPSIASVYSVEVWYSCTNPGFLRKLGLPALALKSTLNGFDNVGFDLFGTDLNSYLIEKLLVLLGDKYRAMGQQPEDSTPVVQYPLQTNNGLALAGAIYADCSVLYRRPVAASQDDLGTVYCSSSNTILGPNGCSNYKEFSTIVPRYNDVVISEPALYPASAWTSTGLFAIPGQTIRVKRIDNRADIKLYINFWYQRTGTTKSMKSKSDTGTSTYYDRPQYMRSADIVLTSNTEIQVTAPYGGPIYLNMQLSGVSVSSKSSPVQVSFSNVAKHPALLDISDPAQNIAFTTAVRNSPIPIMDIRAPGFELHMRSDFFLSNLRYLTLLQNYSGVNGVNTMLNDIRFNFVESQYTLAGVKIAGKTLKESLSKNVLATCASLNWNCTDESLHVRNGIQHANYDEHASCGSGCSGNPFDMDWSMTPLGWGEAHELGHNMQTSYLQISWVPATSSANVWSNYQNRATENSNNMFPFHNQWRFYRKVMKYNNTVPNSWWRGHLDSFSIVQSALAKKNATISGSKMRVSLKSGTCTVKNSFPLTASAKQVASDSVYADNSYAADNDARMSFYLQLPEIFTNMIVAKGTANLRNGFDIITLLYQSSRLFNKFGSSDAIWRANRASLGFDLFNQTCKTTDPCRGIYGSSSVTSIPGNDFVLVGLSFLSGFDFRPYFDVRGLKYTWLASAQVDRHISTGVVYKGPISTNLFALNDFPPADLVSGVRTVPLDGVSRWPFTRWAPQNCTLA